MACYWLTKGHHDLLGNLFGSKSGMPSYYNQLQSSQGATGYACTSSIGGVFAQSMPGAGFFIQRELDCGERIKAAIDRVKEAFQEELTYKIN